MSFSHARHTIGVAHFRQYLQAFLAEPLKSIWRRARLVSAASKKARTTTTHSFGDRKCLGAAFNGTRSGNNGKVVATNRGITYANDRFLRAQIQRNQLVWFANPDCFSDACKVFEIRKVNRSLVSSNTNGSARCSRHRMWFEAQVFNDPQDSLNLAVCSVGLHYG